jgi:hypothetical protein
MYPDFIRLSFWLEYSVHKMKHWSNDIDRRKYEVLEDKPVPAPFCHKSHKDWPGVEPGPMWWEAGTTLMTKFNWIFI